MHEDIESLGEGFALIGMIISFKKTENEKN